MTYVTYNERKRQAARREGIVWGVVSTLLIINTVALALWAWGTFGHLDLWAKPQCTFSEPRG